MSAPTRVLASFLSDLAYPQLPPEAVEKAKFVLLDTLGATIAGSQTPEGRIAVELARKLAGKPECTLIASDVRADCLYAALCNGIMSHALELDDGNRFAMGHPGVTVIPAVVALGELEEISGKDAIVSIVAGYEAFGRIAAAGNPSHYNRGYHTTGTCGTFAAGAAAGKIFRFDADRMVQVLGIAGSQSAGLFAFMSNGAMTKVLHPGKAAQSGILSAFLIRQGFTGPDTVLEHPQGFYAAYADQFVPERITDRLGEPLEIMHTYTKYHAACRHVHSASDAALMIRKEHAIDPDAVDRIAVRTYRVAAKLTGGKEITTPLSGKMSLPYSIAAAVVEGRVGLKEFSAGKLADPKILGLMQRVEVTIDEKLDRLVPKHRGARVEIVMKNGDRYQQEVLDAVGEPENPGGPDNLLNKFRGCTEGVFDPQRIEAIIETVLQLETVDSFSKVTRLLTKQMT